MTISARITDLFSIELPIIQSPLLSLGTPELIAAVSQSGGLGLLDGSFLNQDELYNQISAVEMLSDKPFGVHLLLSKRERSPEDKINERLDELMSLYDIPSPMRENIHLKPRYDSLDDLVDLIIDQKVPVVFFSMGIPNRDIIERLKKAGIVIVGHVSHMLEALRWQDRGADAVMLQGMEAGGLRTTFIGEATEVMMPSAILLEQAKQLLSIPSIVSGGICSYEQVAGLMIQGADAIAAGSAFAMTDESTLSTADIATLQQSNEFDSRIIDRWLGLYARTYMNDAVHSIDLAELDQLTLASRYELLHQVMQVLNEREQQNEVKESASATEDDDNAPQQSIGLMQHKMLFPGLNVQLCRQQSVYQLMASLTVKNEE